MKAVILAGGLGQRLKPFTQIIPKPLLPLGKSSVLETQILSLKKCGIKDVIIATNYLSDYVRAFLDGKNSYDINISISEENKPLGTCGPLSLLKEQLKTPFLLINGDILTTMDFSILYDYLPNVDADIIVGIKEIKAPFEFGQIISEGNYIIDIHEKPDLKMEILSGIYLIKPHIIDLIPKDTYYGIDNLIKNMVSKKMKVVKYKITDYWLDIGRIEDYNAAQEAYNEHFSND
jgi:NDP-mannose synthase